MAKIVDIYAQYGGEPMFICDFSPPRGAAYHNHDIDLAQSLSADILSVPYNPGKSVYANSAMTAHSLRSVTDKEVVFTIATRDANKLAMQSLLLGAALLGLQNVVVARGDDFTPTDIHYAKPVNDYTPTALIRSIAAMNEGIDFRGRSLRAPTDFCIGATIDTNRDQEAESSLTYRKALNGARFFITQPGFTPESPLRFLETYESAQGEMPPVPIFFGVQMVAPGSRSFSEIPQTVIDALDKGSASADLAERAIDGFLAAGISAIYLMPPIFPGGARDYKSAQSVISRFKAGASKD